MLRLLILVTLVTVGRSWSHEMENNLENHRSDYEVILPGGNGPSSDGGGYYSQGYQHSRPDSYHYVDMTYQEEPPFYHHRKPPLYHHHPHPYHHDSFPWHWFILAKAIFWKVKFLTLLKFTILAFFKIPFFLLILALKILFFIKVLKLAKLAITLPLLIPLGLLLLVPLIPLLLAPLLLLPLLIPLLLLLPIPALAPPAGGGATQKNANESRDQTSYYSSLSSLRGLLETDECIERIACRIAPNRITPYTAFISWALDKMTALIRHPKFKAYVDAYKSSSIRRNGQTCSQVYRCNSFY